MRRRSKQSKFSEHEILSAFLAEKPDKTVFGNWRIDGNKLIYRAQSSKDAPRWHDQKDFNKSLAEINEMIRDYDGKLVDSEGRTVLAESLTKDTPNYRMRLVYWETNLVAQKITGADGVVNYLGNSDILPLVGRTVAYGNVSENRYETEMQQEMRARNFVMLPMSDFASADFSTFKTLDTSPGLNVTVKEGYNRSETTSKYFPGARLFTLENTHYLYDIDRRETRYGHYNVFLTKLPSDAGTIDAAYETLKPQVVKDAEAKGLNVKRQGRMFFIPSEAPKLREFSTEERMYILGAKAGYDLEPQIVEYLTGKNIRGDKGADALIKHIPRRIVMSCARGSYDLATAIEIDGVTYCKGPVDSNKRAKLHLDNWHIVVPRIGAAKPEVDDE